MPAAVTDFEICGFHKNTKIQVSQKRMKHYFFQIKKFINHTSRDKLLQKMFL